MHLVSVLLEPSGAQDMLRDRSQYCRNWADHVSVEATAKEWKSHAILLLMVHRVLEASVQEGVHVWV